MMFVGRRKKRSSVPTRILSTYKLCSEQKELLVPRRVCRNSPVNIFRNTQGCRADCLPEHPSTPTVMGGGAAPPQPHGPSLFIFYRKQVARSTRKSHNTKIPLGRTLVGKMVLSDLAGALQGAGQTFPLPSR